MPSFQRKRTRRSDREDVLDALGTAYADGQIDEREHERRVGQALVAADVQDLRALVADLQLPSDHPAASILKPESPTPAVTSGTRRLSRRWVAGLAAFAVVGVGAGVVAEIADDAAEREELDLLTEECIVEFVAAVEAEFGTTELVSVEMHDTWAWVNVPTEDGSGRFERYTYSADGFAQHQGGSLADADPDLIDLTELDTAQLVANVAEAPALLGVEGETEVVVHVTDSYAATYFASVVHGAGEVPPHVEISVTNEFMEQGTLTTDLSGDRVLDQQPFER